MNAFPTDTLNTIAMEDESLNTTDKWRGKFGDDYAQRNTKGLRKEGRRRMFRHIIGAAYPTPRSIVEFGAGKGENLEVLMNVLSDFADVRLTGVEINKAAFDDLEQTPHIHAIHGDAATTYPGKHNMAITCGFLIHVPAAHLIETYRNIRRSATRFICLCEYYNPTPLEVPYRGLKNGIIKRDFAGEMMDMYPELRLLDYGFVYHRDRAAALDDITWFLMEVDNQ